MRTGASIVLTVLALAVGSSRAWAIGPSFDCTKAEAPLAKMICASPTLSRLDLRLMQAYQALRYQLDQAGRDALAEESNAFAAEVRARCGVSASSPSLITNPATALCVKEKYEKEHNLWVRRLTWASKQWGPAQLSAVEEATRPLQQQVVLQADLRRLGFLPPDSAINGVYGAATRTAIVAWQESRHVPVTGFLSDGDAASIQDQVAQREQKTPQPRGPNLPITAANAPLGATLAEFNQFFPKCYHGPDDGLEGGFGPFNPANPVEGRDGGIVSAFLTGLDFNILGLRVRGCGKGKSRISYGLDFFNGRILDVTKDIGYAGDLSLTALLAKLTAAIPGQQGPVLRESDDSIPDHPTHYLFTFFDSGSEVTVVEVHRGRPDIFRPMPTLHRGIEAYIAYISKRLFHAYEAKEEKAKAVAKAAQAAIQEAARLAEAPGAGGDETAGDEAIDRAAIGTVGLGQVDCTKWTGGKTIHLPVHVMKGDVPQQLVLRLGRSGTDCTEEATLQLGGQEAFDKTSDDTSSGQIEPANVLGNGLQQIVVRSEGADGGAGEDVWSFATGKPTEVVRLGGSEGIPRVTLLGNNQLVIFGWWWPDGKSHAEQIESEAIVQYHPQAAEASHTWTLLQGSRVAFRHFVIVPKSRYAEPLGTWYALSRTEECVPLKESLGIPSPAALIRFDRLNGLKDEVDVFETKGGNPVAVKVGEPQGNGLEEFYTFFRGEAMCEAYAEKRSRELRNLN